MDILCDIQKKYTGFSDKEKSIADYILENSENINNISSKSLAVETKSSGATVTRFCKKIGCDSFVDMKIKLSSTKLGNDNKKEGILSDIYSYYNEVIERTKQLIDKNMINKVIDEIRKADKIYIYGVGSSGLTAKEMMQRMLRMGFNVHSISDSHMMVINSSIVSEKDLVIGISISGETEELLQSIKIAKKNKAKIVSITSFHGSSISKESDMSFIVYNTLFVDKERFINSQFSAMYLLDIISMILLQEKDLREKMKATVKAINNC